MTDQPPRMPKRSLPVTWNSGKSGTPGAPAPIHSRAAVIAEPTLEDIAAFSDQNAKTCGSCKFFHPPDKNRPTIRGFLARAIYEAGWKKEYMGDSPENMTRCRENADLVVTMNSKSCDHYRPGKGGIR